MNTTFANRLIALSDGRLGLRNTIQVAASLPPGQSPPYTLDFVSSDETLDRYGEIISAAGWNLASYLKNPIFQNAHQYGDIIFTLGKATLTEVRSVAGRPCLFQRIQFAADVNPIASVAYGLYHGGFVRGVSAGLIPIRWEIGGPDSHFRLKYLEQELVEVSAVAIPANPNALALALKSGAVEKSSLLNMAGLLAQTIRGTEVSDSTTLLKEIAHQLHQVLRRA